MLLKQEFLDKCKTIKYAYQFSIFFSTSSWVMKSPDSTLLEAAFTRCTRFSFVIVDPSTSYPTIVACFLYSLLIVIY